MMTMVLMMWLTASSLLFTYLMTTRICSNLHAPYRYDIYQGDKWLVLPHAPWRPSCQRTAPHSIPPPLLLLCPWPRKHSRCQGRSPDWAEKKRQASSLHYALMEDKIHNWPLHYLEDFHPLSFIEHFSVFSIYQFFCISLNIYYFISHTSVELEVIYFQ